MRLFLLILTGTLLSSGAFAQDNVAPPASLEPVLAGLTTDRLFKTATVGLQVIDVATGEEVFAFEPDRPLSPASTMKVVTAAAALRHLGPAYTFTTPVLTDGRLDGAGTLKGNLYVQGSGDPHLVVEKLWKLIRDVKLAGVETIDGDLIFDEGFFDTDYALPGWDKPRDLQRGPSYFPSLGALSLNFNTVALVVGPGLPGGPGRVQLETPASDYVEVVNQVVTGSDRARRRIAVAREQISGGKLRFTVSGTVPAGATSARYYRSVLDPTSHFAAAWAEMMRESGISLTGNIRRGTVPEGARVVAEHTSPPLTSILMDVNKYSNNFMAEQVLRTLGAEVKGAPGSTAKGLEVVREYLDALGVDPETYHLVNGSGLSRDLRLAPSVLTAVLVDMARDGQAGQEFASSLAIAGKDGTLMRRLTEEAGRMRGKTGTIDGVHCLTGYLDAGNGNRYAFAFLVNDLPGSADPARRAHDRFVREVLATTEPDAVVVEGGEP